MFSGVVDDGDGEVVGSLQVAQIAEYGSYIGGLVFVDAVEAHERIEQEQARCVSPHRLGEALLVAEQIEPHRRCCDDADRKSDEVETSVTAEPFEALLDDGRGVFGHVDQRGTGFGDGEGIQAGRATGDRDGEIESEPALSQFRGSSYAADAGASPEGLDEPASFRFRLVQFCGAHDRERGIVLGVQAITACAEGDASIAASMV